MHKKQQDRKRRKNPFVPELFERYFRRNEGTTDYATIPEVTLAGDFVMEMDFSTTSTGNQILLGDSHTASYYLNVGASRFSFWVAGVEATFDHGGVQDGVLRNIKAVLTGVSLEMFLDGVSLGTRTIVPYTGVNNFLIYNSNSIQTTFIFSGILANLKIYDNGTLIRDYPLDDNSDILRDRANGQSGTVINGNASDWGLFQQQATGEWLGLNAFDFSTLSGVDVDWTIDTYSAFVDTAKIITAPALFSDALKITNGAVYRCGFEVSGFSGSGRCGFSNISFSGTPLIDRSLDNSGNFLNDMTASSDTIQMFRYVDSGVGQNTLSKVSVKEVLNVA